MRFAIIGLSIALSGCSMFMKSIEKPTAAVQSVAVSSAGFSGVTGELRLDVTKAVQPVLAARKTKVLTALLKGLETDDETQARRILEVINA
ncbi:MAG: hypothetical protein H0T42_31950, partial [Deltaproteobacteria bacterium]|nr:hypothetical protein [Deltaproteobacteria bacterium]